MRPIYTRPYQRPGLLTRLRRSIDWQVVEHALILLFMFCSFCLMFALLEAVSR